MEEEKDRSHEGEEGKMATEQRKEAGPFNNSPTPATFRIESSPKTGPMCPPCMTDHPQCTDVCMSVCMHLCKGLQRKQRVQRHCICMCVNGCLSAALLTSRHGFLLKD